MSDSIVPLPPLLIDRWYRAADGSGDAVLVLGYELPSSADNLAELSTELRGAVWWRAPGAHRVEVSYYPSFMAWTTGNPAPEGWHGVAPLSAAPVSMAAESPRPEDPGESGVRPSVPRVYTGAPYFNTHHIPAPVLQCWTDGRSFAVAYSSHEAADLIALVTERPDPASLLPAARDRVLRYDSDAHGAGREVTETALQAIARGVGFVCTSEL